MESATRSWIRDNIEQVVDKGKQAEYEAIFGKDLGRWTRGDYQRERIIHMGARLERAIYQVNSKNKLPEIDPPDVPRPIIRYDNSTAVQMLKDELARHNERRRAAGLEV